MENLSYNKSNNVKTADSRSDCELSDNISYTTASQNIFTHYSLNLYDEQRVPKKRKQETGLKVRDKR